MQDMLEAEMDRELSYSKCDHQNKETDDHRNGYTKKTVTFSLFYSFLHIFIVMIIVKYFLLSNLIIYNNNIINLIFQ